MHAPLDIHLVAAKRILRYLSGTSNLGLCFRKGATDIFRLIPIQILTCSVPLLTNVPTSSFVIFLGYNPVSWDSK